jgi:MFS family permease
VYSPSIGFTQAIGESAKQLVGLSGIFIGIGEVFGGVSFGLMGSRITTKIGRDPIVILGFIVHLIAFFLIFLNIPNNANFGDTSDIGECLAALFIDPQTIHTFRFPSAAYLDPPLPWLALLCSFLLGFGDSCFNTQIYSMLGGVFKKHSTEAFSIFKFTQVSVSRAKPALWGRIRAHSLKVYRQPTH